MTNTELIANKAKLDSMCDTFKKTTKGNRKLIEACCRELSFYLSQHGVNIKDVDYKFLTKIRRKSYKNERVIELVIDKLKLMMKTLEDTSHANTNTN